MNDPASLELQWRKLFDYLVGNQASWVIDIGLRAGLFRAIADAGERGVGDAALAGNLGMNSRYLAIWCRAAYAFELLEWDEERGYRLAPHIATLLLDGDHPRFIGGRIQFFTALYQDFLAFPHYLRSGGTWPRSEHDPWILEALKNMTRPDAIVIADVVIPQAPEARRRLADGGTLLDIGAGAGHALVAYANRFPRARVVGIEFDGPSVELARRAIHEAGLADRIEIRRADATRLEDVDAYDVVTMNVALHEVGGPPEYREVLARVARALLPGGSVIVSEIPYPDSPREYREKAVYRALAGVQLHEALVGCGMITQNQLDQLLRGAGFRDVRVAEQPLPTRVMMIGER